jgi:hypothetical protein
MLCDLGLREKVKGFKSVTIPVRQYKVALASALHPDSS